MPRTIDFDYDTAIDRATAVFWKHGYAGASLRELLKAIGIGEGSFYNTLKSKKRLYLECLKHYDETEGLRRRRALVEAPTVGQGVRAMFVAVLDGFDDPHAPSRLCMLAAMASEEVLADPELRRRVEDAIDVVQKLLVERLNRDRDAGLLPAGLDPEIVASVVATYAQGLWRMAMVSYDRARFERQIEVFLTGLGLGD